jgi:hypothetical protein
VVLAVKMTQAHITDQRGLTLYLAPLPLLVVDLAQLQTEVLEVLEVGAEDNHQTQVVLETLLIHLHLKETTEDHQTLHLAVVVEVGLLPLADRLLVVERPLVALAEMEPHQQYPAHL